MSLSLLIKNSYQDSFYMVDTQGRLPGHTTLAVTRGLILRRVHSLALLLCFHHLEILHNV